MTKSLTQFLEDSANITLAGMQAIVSEEITAKLQPKLHSSKWWKQDRTLITRGGDNKRRFSKRGNVNAGVGVENNDIPDSTLVRSYVEVETVKVNASILLTSEAIDGADFNVVSDDEDALADGMARFHEEKSRDGISGAVQAVSPAKVMTTAAGGFGTSTKSEVAVGSNTFAFDAVPFVHRKVLKIVSSVHSVGGAMTLGTHFFVDFFDGIMKVVSIGAFTYGAGETVTVTYVYSDVTSATSLHVGMHFDEVGTVNQIGWTDLVNSRALIQASDGEPDVIWTDVGGMTDFLKDDKFVAAKWDNASLVVFDGVIGMIAGSKVHASTIQYQGVTFLLKSLDIGWEVVSEALRTRLVELEDRIGDIKVMTQSKYTFAMLRPELVTIVLNAHPFAVFAPA